MTNGAKTHPYKTHPYKRNDVLWWRRTGWREKVTVYQRLGATLLKVRRQDGRLVTVRADECTPVED